MSAIRLSHHPRGYVEHGRQAVLYLTDVTDGWWAGLSRRCACGGNLIVDPPELRPGAVLCLLCTRPVAEVLERPVSTVAPDRPKRGRPPKPPATPDINAQRRRQREYRERRRQRAGVAR